MANNTPRKKPSIRDVALEAGVSIGTVSNVLNRPEHIHPETLAKVRKAIAHLNFVPSPGARSRRRHLSSKEGVGSGEAIGILFLGIGGLRWMANQAPIYAYALHGAEQVATQLGSTCQILHAIDLQSLAYIARDLPKGGLILLTGDEAPRFPENFSLPPIVKIMGLSNTKWGDCCTHNSYGSGRVAAEYLYEVGCRHVACIGGNDHGLTSLRIQGCESTFTLAGGTVCPRPDIGLFSENHVPDEAAVLEFTKAVLKSKPKTDGLFITADMLAPLVYRALAKIGIRPGKDIKLVSCNNERPYLADLTPPPAVVDIHGELVGSEAVKLLHWRRQNPNEPRRTLIIEPSLVIPKTG